MDEKFNLVTQIPYGINQVLDNIGTLQGLNAEICNGQILINGKLKRVLTVQLVEPPPDIETRMYIVQKGDTLEVISRRFDVFLSDILKVNPEIEEDFTYQH